jgi:hypothetical protein
MLLIDRVLACEPASTACNQERDDESRSSPPFPDVSVSAGRMVIEAPAQAAFHSCASDGRHASVRRRFAAFRGHDNARFGRCCRETN